MRRLLSIQSISDIVLGVAAVVLVGWVIARDSRLTGKAASGQATEPYDVPGWDAALQVGTELGVAEGELKVVEFLDLECAACAAYHSSVTKVLLGRTEPPFVSWTVVHFPLKSHANAQDAARAAECARQSGRFGEFIDAALSTRGAVVGRRWNEIATSAGVEDIDAFAKCLESATALAPADSGRAFGDRLGVNATPTIIVNGRRFPSPPGVERILSEIDNKPRTAAGMP